jgi:hypothetical protein
VVHRSFGPSRKAREAGDVAWVPPAPWDSELRESSGPTFLGAYVGATSGQDGGKVREGLEISFLKRNWWGQLNALSFGGLLENVVEFTSNSSTYTSFAAFGTGRWYVFNPLGLVADIGVDTEDLSPAHVHPWSFQSRYGLVLTIGRLDIVVESPTLPRYDWVNGEILTARLGIEGVSF